MTLFSELMKTSTSEPWTSHTMKNSRSVVPFFKFFPGRLSMWRSLASNVLNKQNKKQICQHANLELMIGLFDFFFYLKFFKGEHENCSL